jgi:hypothetical protein
VAAVAFGWLFAVMSAHDLAMATTGLSLIALLVAAVFGLFFVTEQAALSPRVAAHVPQNRLLATLVAPFLPGRERGLACLLGFVVLVGGLWWCGNRVPHTGSFATALRRMVLLGLPYLLFWLLVARLVRARLPDAPGANLAARVLVPVLLFFACIVPVLLDVFLVGSVRRWHWGHVLNPFWTLEEHSGSAGAGVDRFAVGATAVLLGLHLPAVVRGVREVLRASAARRAAVAAGSGATAGG